MRSSKDKNNRIKELIGKGSSALVYKVIDLVNNKIYAIKESISKDAEFLFKNEINIFNIFQNKSPYIIHFYNYIHLPTKINLELEYCQYGSLRDLLKKAKKKRIKLTENEISSIIYMVLNGLNFMHENNLINRDIKSKNILVNKDGIAKLCDFGISQFYKKDLYPKNKFGSPYWMAPELINIQKYNKSIDIWSLGITCIELAEYEPPYINYDKNEALERIRKNPPKGLSSPFRWSKEFNDFVEKCLKVNRFERPSCKELLEHKFIKNIEQKNLNRKLIILQMLSRIGCQVLYNKKNINFKKIRNEFNSNNIAFSKTFYNTKNNFKPRKSPFDNFNFINNETHDDSPNKNNDEIYVDNSLKNSFNYNINNNTISDMKSILKKRQNENVIQPSIRKFNLKSKILQKRIINLKYDNFNNLDNSESNIYEQKNINNNFSINKYNDYINNNKTNRLSNHTISMSYLNESINNKNDFMNKDGLKNIFIGRLKNNRKNRNQFTDNNSLNISEFNQKRIINGRDTQENGGYRIPNISRYDYYSNRINKNNQNNKKLNKTLYDNGNETIYINRINMGNSDISRNIFIKKRNNIIYMPSNNNVKTEEV